MTTPSSRLSTLIPGFDFLQDLVKNAGSAMPGVSQWIAPTLDPAVIDKRIEELRTVQFWLEQNARMLAASIQALEVQRMTLSTLKTMNVTVGELGQAMKLRTPEPAPAPAAKGPRKAAPEAAAAPTGVVDPMQWWGALTQQFAQLAVQTLKDSGSGATQSVSDAMAGAAADAPAPSGRANAAKPARTAAEPAAAATPRSRKAR